MSIGYQGLKRLRALRDGLSRIVRPQGLVLPGVDEGLVPASASDGVDVSDTSLARIGVINQEIAGEHSVWLQVGIIASGDEWGVSLTTSILGEPIATEVLSDTDDATVYAEELLEELMALRDEWNSESSRPQWLSATILDDGVSIRLRFAGWVRCDLTELETVGEGGGLRVVQEAAVVSFEAFGLEPASGTWERIEGASGTLTGPGGAVSIDVAGFSRVYVSIPATDGVCIPMVAVSTASDNAPDLIADAVATLQSLRATIPTRLAMATRELRGGIFGAFPKPPRGTEEAPDLYAGIKGAIMAILTTDKDNMSPEGFARLSRSVSSLVPLAPALAKIPDALSALYRDRPDVYAEMQRKAVEAAEHSVELVCDDRDKLADLILSILEF